MTVSTPIRCALAPLVVVALGLFLASAALAEPKNQTPFTRGAEKSSPRPVQGEPKNETPFVASTGADVVVRGEPKDQAPFTSTPTATPVPVRGEPKGEVPFTTPSAAPTIVVRTTGGLDWTAFGIGAAAMLGLAAIVAGAALLALHSRRDVGMS